jgi:hypothetical protein
MLEADILERIDRCIRELEAIRAAPLCGLLDYPSGDKGQSW